MPAAATQKQVSNSSLAQSSTNARAVIKQVVSSALGGLSEEHVAELRVWETGQGYTLRASWRQDLRK